MKKRICDLCNKVIGQQAHYKLFEYNYNERKFNPLKQEMDICNQCLDYIKKIFNDLKKR